MADNPTAHPSGTPSQCAVSALTRRLNVLIVGDSELDAE